MATRSAIIEKTSIGGNHPVYRGIYCHSDGYLDGVGAVLLSDFKTPEQVSCLLDQGDLSYLSFGGDFRAYHTWVGREESWESVGTKLGYSVEEVVKTIDHNGYVYVFADGVWTVNGLPLTPELTEDELAEKGTI